MGCCRGRGSEEWKKKEVLSVRKMGVCGTRVDLGRSSGREEGQGRYGEAMK